MGDETDVHPHMCGSSSGSRDRALARLAGRQHGVVARTQMVACGFGHRAIERMVTSGRLHLLHRGVYAVGHRLLTRESRFMAATLATGGILSHRSAGVLHRVVVYDGPIEVTTAAERRSRTGIVCRCSALPPDERTVIGGIPVTTSPRTLLDLAAVLPERRLQRAVNEAERLRLTDALSVPDLLARYPRRRGTAKLCAIESRGGEVTRSVLEDRFLVLVERFDLPRPSMNATRSGYEVDAIYPSARLIVELDGRAVHTTRLTFDEDRERDRRLAVQGWRVVRLTDHHLKTQAAAIARDLRVLLGHPSIRT